LVVEDEPGMRLAMDRILRSYGYDVATAADGIDGLAEFRRMPADLVIADLYLPDKDGLETIVDLMKELPIPKIIAMSGHRAKDLLLQSAERLGALEVIHKPFSAESLAAVVARVLRKKKAASATTPGAPNYPKASAQTRSRPAC
jgi:DNA-binding response OmpR family regulator